jgi:hypothetical protein
VRIGELTQCQCGNIMRFGWSWPYLAVGLRQLLRWMSRKRRARFASRPHRTGKSFRLCKALCLRLQWQFGGVGVMAIAPSLYTNSGGVEGRPIRHSDGMVDMEWLRQRTRGGALVAVLIRTVSQLDRSCADTRSRVSATVLRCSEVEAPLG